MHSLVRNSGFSTAQGFMIPAPDLYSHQTGVKRPHKHVGGLCDVTDDCTHSSRSGAGRSAKSNAPHTSLSKDDDGWVPSGDAHR